MNIKKFFYEKVLTDENLLEIKYNSSRNILLIFIFLFLFNFLLLGSNFDFYFLKISFSILFIFLIVTFIHFFLFLLKFKLKNVFENYVFLILDILLTIIGLILILPVLFDGGVLGIYDLFYK